MAIVLGLASALVYGAGDFLGALASKRSTAYAVVVWSQFAGLLVLLVAVAVLGEALPPSRDLLWGAIGGIGGGTGVVLLYRGLAMGRMAIVAPTTGVVAATIPVLVGLVLGERPAALALLGVVIALGAIALVSAVPTTGAITTGSRGRLPAGTLEAIGAGAGFALFFICLAQTSGESALWPLAAARISIGVAAVAGLVFRSSLRPVAGSWTMILACGLLDMTANLLYILAAQQGLLSIVAVLVSLYPASTVLLARVVLRERLSVPQLGGLLAAAAGVALIAAA